MFSISFLPLQCLGPTIGQLTSQPLAPSRISYLKQKHISVQHLSKTFISQNAMKWQNLNNILHVWQVKSQLICPNGCAAIYQSITERSIYPTGDISTTYQMWYNYTGLRSWSDTRNSTRSETYQCCFLLPPKHTGCFQKYNILQNLSLHAVSDRQQ